MRALPQVPVLSSISPSRYEPEVELPSVGYGLPYIPKEQAAAWRDKRMVAASRRRDDAAAAGLEGGVASSIPGREEKKLSKKIDVAEGALDYRTLGVAVTAQRQVNRKCR